MSDPGPIELVTYGDEDLPLTEALETDPAVMRELGGPIARDAIPAIHRRRLAGIADGDWWFKIVAGEPRRAAGTIGLWEREWDGAEVHEVGWMVLPAFQGRGVAGAALARLLERARAQRRAPSVHAFPGRANAASNALCRRAGFVPGEDCDVDYAGRPLRCTHWSLKLG